MTSGSTRTTAGKPPTLRVEKRLLRERGARLLAGMDEVGRGAFAGPVSVGVCVVDLDSPTAPSGLRDSKLLAAPVRERLVPRLRRWSVSCAVGSASAAEIDIFGILPALRLAGERALAQLPEPPDLVLLDGNYNWLRYRRPAVPTLFDDAPDDVAGEVAALAAEPWPVPESPPGVDGSCIPVTTMIKADLRCAAVAAASVLAKVTRDAEMVRLAATETRYGWHENKGYASPEHLEALREHGPCEHHRRSWRLRVLEGRVPAQDRPPVLDDAVEGVSLQDLSLLDREAVL
ncbi:MAG: ribonuclease HII [Actinomycetales bacterium]